jgi:type I restriction-modification system DNA methylase subunit
MDTERARDLITDTFEQSYDEEQFRLFVRNLIPDVREDYGGHRSGSRIFEPYREHVSQYKRLGKYTDPGQEEMDVLAVKLRTAHKLERARTMQRNFVSRYLDERPPGRNAALVAYYAEGSDDWRLSLVRREYRTIIDEQGNVAAEESPTPVRYSFLVGASEPSHTAKRQFEKYLTSEAAVSLEDIRDAFSIDRVTDDFFEAYRDHYERLAEEVENALEADKSARQEFEDKSITADVFAKKLLGQLVFLYFLQKKGWLGVERGDEWGEGPKNFLRQLFEGDYVSYDNFYQDLLEPLFYDALATDRGGGNYFGRLQCRIPFLNGGLFEPVNNFERARVHLPLSDELFASIFETFDRYNFTVREDEPLEKEVAVDPEMLGKVFEQLLTSSRKKKLGAFYTPRDIVTYMCQQSLIDHLDTEINVRDTPLLPPRMEQQEMFGDGRSRQGVLSGASYNPQVDRSDLQALIRNGTNWIEHDQRVRDGDETPTYSSYRAPESIRRHAEVIDTVLATVKTCDPAVGSGAFPVSLMQEIVQARRVLNVYLGRDRSDYELKRQAIQNSIYGVDIDQSAVDIAQLRMWLSLVVDEQDFQEIKPLPNLRYKIVRGDALQQVERHLENNRQVSRLHDLMAQYVEAAHPSRKEEIQDKIDSLLIELVGDDTFDFHLYFGTVWKEKEGFDIVIGNPPYVRHENQVTEKSRLKSNFRTYKSGADLYVYFIERGVELLRPKGVFCYIVNNKWMRAKYGEELRKWLKRRDIVELIDFGDTPIFPGTVVYPCILRIHKTKPDSSLRAAEVSSLDYRDEGTLTEYVSRESYQVQYKSLNDEGWSLVGPEVQELLDSISFTGTRLVELLGDGVYRGIITGLNDAFVISRERRREIVETDPSSENFIHPFLSGTNVSRYEPVHSNEFVIVVPSGWTRTHSDDGCDEWNWFRDKYPGIASHLSNFEDQARDRYDQGDCWWELRPCRYYDKFESPKILFPDLSREGDFTIDDEGYYAANTIYMIPKGSKYLLGVLNSTLMTFYYANHFSVYRGGYLRFFTQYVERLPIRTIDEDCPDDVALRENLVAQVDQILELHEDQVGASTDVERREIQQRIDSVDDKIDQIVYELYGLSAKDVDVLLEALPDYRD